MFKEGDKVAYGNSYGPAGWTVSEVVRLTPTQAVLADGSKVRQSDGTLMGKGFRAKPYEDVSEEIERWKIEQAAKNELARMKGRMCALYDEMRKGYFDGFTAEQLSGVVDAMEAVLIAKNKTREG